MRNFRAAIATVWLVVGSVFGSPAAAVDAPETISGVVEQYSAIEGRLRVSGTSYGVLPGAPIVWTGNRSAGADALQEGARVRLNVRPGAVPKSWIVERIEIQNL